MPIKTVLCPIDLSTNSTHAIEQASAVAGWYKARLIVLHAYAPLFVPVPGLPAPPDRVPEYERQRVRDQVRLLIESAAMGAGDVDVIVDVGHPSALILERAAALPADLIVMGTHGLSGFERWVLGSVAERVLRRAPCPVLTVPPRAHATSRLPFVRVLCAVDFSEWSSAALELASSLAQESGAALDLVHVVEWPWPEPPPPAFAELPPVQAAALTEFRRYLVQSATSRLESLVSEPIRNRCAAVAHVAHGTPYVEILRTAADEHADLIVLGVHGRSGFDLTLFGSTANQVVRRATCPVLTLRR